jgi:hypothetical protein
MTDLVERYLSAVERRLPEKSAKDIVAELREAVLAQVEAKEAELGRALNADEVAAVLQAYGAPAVVAARYEGRMHLVGPELYPWFWPAQRTAMGAMLAIGIVIVAIRALASDEPVRTMLRSVDNVLGGVLLAFAIVTLVFVAIERWGDPEKIAARSWDPKSLPREHIRKPKSMFEAGISLFFDTVFILFWLQFIPFPNELPLRDGASVAVTLSPAWAAVYWPVLALAVLAALGHIHDILRPAWSRIRSAMSITGYAGGLVVLWVLFQSRPFVDVTPKPGTSAEDLERALRLVDGVMLVGLGIAGLIWSITLGVEVYRQIRAARLAAPGAVAAH